MGIGAGFVGFEVVQRGFQQRDGPGACGTGANGEPRDAGGEVETHQGRFHVQLQAEPGAERLLQFGPGEGVDILQPAEGLIHRVLRRPGGTVERFEGVVIGGRGAAVPIRDRQRGALELLVPGRAGIA